MSLGEFLVDYLKKRTDLKPATMLPARSTSEQARNVSTGTDPSLVATLVATVSGNPGNSQEFSRKTAATSAATSVELAWLNEFWPSLSEDARTQILEIAKATTLD